MTATQGFHPIVGITTHRTIDTSPSQARAQRLAAERARRTQTAQAQQSRSQQQQSLGISRYFTAVPDRNSDNFFGVSRAEEQRIANRPRPGGPPLNLPQTIRRGTTPSGARAPVFSGVAGTAARNARLISGEAMPANRPIGQ